MNELNEKCIPSKRERENKAFQIKKAIWKVSGEFSWVSKGTKYEG